MKYFHFCSFYNVGIQHTKYYRNPCVGRFGTPLLLSAAVVIAALRVKEWFEIKKMAKDLNLMVNMELSNVSSDANFGKRFGPIQAQEKFGPAWSLSNCLTLMIFLKDFFLNLILKNQQTTKWHEKLPSRQRENA